MSRKFFSTLIPIFLVFSFGWTFYGQHKANNLLSEIANTPENEIVAVMVRNTAIGKWIVLRNIPNSVLASLLEAFGKSESAMGYRPINPHNNIVIRIETKNGAFDFDFRSHDEHNKWVKFTLVNRSYFGKSSFTQDHLGDFKSKELFKFLQYVENES
ncbi:hypothetical protein [Shewanella sp. 10N.286.54.B9]|uniref:hypothetical protein n=1 Tax=Shewanella sp. 10N.286.54.B9 TaxID=3229719 RepID=UPI00354E4E66